MLATALYLTVAVSACSQIEPLQNDLTSAELTNAKNIKYTIRDLNNWGNLANHLSAAGVSDLRLAQVFSDKRIPTFINMNLTSRRANLKTSIKVLIDQIGSKQLGNS